MVSRIYLDYAATTPCDPEVVRAMQPYFSDIFGNASSIHTFGQEAAKAVEFSRSTVARILGARPEEIVFTSGGTESNNFAILGAARALEKKGRHIITSAIEHHAVLEPCHFLKKQGYKVSYLKVDKSGMVNPQDLKAAITDDTVLVSLMHANNEIGVIEPIEDISRILRARQICFHSDAVQTVGHIPVNVDALGVDMLSLSAHKFYGPKGAGALYIRKGTKIQRFMHGGDQERGRRASTLNTPGIAGLVKALELCQARIPQEMETQTKMRQRLIAGILKSIPDVSLNGHARQRLSNNANVSVKYIEGESMVLNLDLEGIACSTASACTSASLEPSHVLLALGLEPEIAHGSLRFSLGRYTKESDIDTVLEVLPRIVKKLRAMSPLYKGA